ncbi:MAG: winged helix-turn-helix transcriptional regulator [Deltaproteobacteria bacterium]|nr:winged helix-turn-helix transcriptional regulator [Candidatus Anaeroferrophillus wilburensis]MBN2889658.1 winged helix-turn-helix transcriptional regulator [Deltaproteobacteria bacterium]
MHDKICHRVAEILKVLGHPIRLRIVQTLLTEESCVKNLWNCLDLPQATVSQHLSVLKGKGIVDSAREGVAMRYWVSDEIGTLIVSTLMNQLQLDCCEGNKPVAGIKE